MMKKADMSMATLAAVVLLVVVLLVSVAIIIYVNSKYQNTKMIADCTSSVRAVAELKQLSEGKLHQDITCPLRNITVDKNNVYDVEREIADEMVTCWQMWGEGKLDLFEDDGVYCHVCSQINFEKNSMTVPAFQDFLDANHPAGNTATYAALLKPVVTRTDETDVPAPVLAVQIEPSVLTTADAYDIVFIYVRGKSITAQVVLREHTTGTFQSLGCQYSPAKQFLTQKY